MSMGTIGDATVIQCAISSTKVMKAIKDNGQAGFISLVISCQKCPKIDAMRGKSQWDPQRVARSFRNAGWEVDAEGRDARCPDCKKRRRGPAEIPIGKSVAPMPPAASSSAAAERSSSSLTGLSLVPPLSSPPPRAPATEPHPILDNLADFDAEEPEEIVYDQDDADPCRTPTLKPPRVPVPGSAPRHPGKAPGTVNHYKPRICAYGPCSKTYVPTGAKQRFHHTDCKRAAERRTPVVTPGPAPSARLPSAIRSEPMDSPATAPPQTPEAVKAERKMYVLLEEHYLVDACHYAGEWDDAKISAESGVAIPRVQFVREGLYGKAVDPYALALQEDIDIALEKIRAERLTLTALVRETCDRQEKELRELRARVTARGG